MTNIATLALRALVFPVAFAAILSCVQLRIEVAQRAPEMAAAANVAVKDFNGFVTHATASILDSGKAPIKVASR